MSCSRLRSSACCAGQKIHPMLRRLRVNLQRCGGNFPAAGEPSTGRRASTGGGLVGLVRPRKKPVPGEQGCDVGGWGCCRPRPDGSIRIAVGPLCPWLCRYGPDARPAVLCRTSTFHAELVGSPLPVRAALVGVPHPNRNRPAVGCAEQERSAHQIGIVCRDLANAAATDDFRCHRFAPSGCEPTNLIEKTRLPLGQGRVERLGLDVVHGFFRLDLCGFEVRRLRLLLLLLRRLSGFRRIFKIEIFCRRSSSTASYLISKSNTNRSWWTCSPPWGPAHRPWRPCYAPFRRLCVASAPAPGPGQDGHPESVGAAPSAPGTR